MRKAISFHQAGAGELARPAASINPLASRPRPRERRATHTSVSSGGPWKRFCCYWRIQDITTPRGKRVQSAHAVLVSKILLLRPARSSQASRLLTANGEAGRPASATRERARRCPCTSQTRCESDSLEALADITSGAPASRRFGDERSNEGARPASYSTSALDNPILSIAAIHRTGRSRCAPVHGPRANAMRSQRALRPPK